MIGTGTEGLFELWGKMLEEAKQNGDGPWCLFDDGYGVNPRYAAYSRLDRGMSSTTLVYPDDEEVSEYERGHSMFTVTYRWLRPGDSFPRTAWLTFGVNRNTGKVSLWAS